MEVVVTEEKKKIFRARKTMKISDRLQLESLHSTLLTTPGLSNPSPPPLMNGTHKEDGQKVGDKEQNNISDSNSPRATPPASPISLSSPSPFLSLNLSPSPVSSESPKPQDDITSPTSPFASDFTDLKKTEDEEKKSSSPPHSNESVTPVPSEHKDQDKNVITTGEKEEEEKTRAEGPAGDSGKNSAKDVVSCSPVPPAVSECIEPMEIETDTTNAGHSEASTLTKTDEKPSSSNVATSSSSSSSPTPHPTSSKDLGETIEIKDDDTKEEEDDKLNKKTASESEEKMEVDKIKSEVKKEMKDVGKSTKPARPSSTPPSNADKEEKNSTSGLKRTLSEGDEKDEVTVKKEGKRPKVEHEELEAQLKLKITAKAGSQHKLEKIVQHLVNEQLKILELAIFDKHFKELKDRVDKIDCATKHQTTINSLQSKISRLAKKFGEANQATENRRKQEALAAANTAVAVAAAAAAAAAVKTPTVTNTPQAQRPVRTSTEVKQTPASVPSSSTAVPIPVSLPATIAAPAPAPIPVPVPIPVPARALTLAPAPVSAPALVTAPPPAPTSTSNTTMVPQGSILQLITSNANAASTLATGITTQSQQGTLLLKTTSGSGIMATGQPLVIQLPLSVNGQTGTLVNFPVSSLSAASSLNKAKTTPSTTTFILKSPSSTNTASATTSTVATLPTLQPSTGQVSTTQISLARAVYQGGAGRITTPNAGVSMTTVRAPVQSVSVAGALSSASSPATSGPAATGSTAPGTPQGTSLTSKTDNQVSVTIPSKPPVPPAAPARPKGSVIDLTEDDDDVQVTGVKNATVTTSSPAPRSNPVISIPNSAGSRSSPKTNQSSTSSPQITVHHRPPLDSSMKPRTVTTTTPSRGSSSSLPALPSAPAPSRLPAEAEQTSPPQQLQLKLVPGQTGIVLSWSVAETDRSCAAVDSYHLYAFHQDNSNSGSAQQHWKKIGEVNALPLPMACTLTQFQSGSTYYFAVRAKDIYGRFGTFCEPQCTNVISSSSS